MVDGIRQILDQAWTLIEADEGRNALAVLQAITEEYLREWENLDGSDGETGEFFNDLGLAWIEAVLSADLSKNERKTWAKRLTVWQGEIDNYGVDEVFDAAATAVTRRLGLSPTPACLAGNCYRARGLEGRTS